MLTVDDITVEQAIKILTDPCIEFANHRLGIMPIDKTRAKQIAQLLQAQAEQIERMKNCANCGIYGYQYPGGCDGDHRCYNNGYPNWKWQGER